MGARSQASLFDRRDGGGEIFGEAKREHAFTRRLLDRADEATPRFWIRETFITAKTDHRRLAIKHDLEACCFHAAFDPNFDLGKPDAVRFRTEAGKRTAIAKQIVRLALPCVRIFEEGGATAPLCLERVFAGEDGLRA